jgi:TatD DNase family protein
MFFDSHCHLTDDRLAGEVDAVVARAREAGVTGLVTIGAEPEDFDTVRDLTERFEGVWAAVGVHPHSADRADAEVLARMVDLAAHPGIVALGETGLDYHYDNAPREAQRRAFVRHIELAADLGLPVVVHSRDADADTAAILRDAGRDVRGVLHCFAGGPELLEAGLDAGWYISISGIVTFRNYGGADLVRAVPGDRLLIETDSPYLAPVPMRGKRNEPAFVRFVAEGLARLLDESVDTVAERTTRNALALYGLDGPATAA